MTPDRSDRTPAVPIRTFLAEPMPEPVARAVRRLARLPGATRIAIMPDVHLAEKVCVGAVLATRGTLYPQAVGGDIGCGITAVALDGDTTALTPDGAYRILAAWGAGIPILRHRNLAAAPGVTADLLAAGPAHPEAASALSRDGRIELGTLGRGNHFLELQRDDDDRLWLMVHSGSRAMGQIITGAYLRAAAPAGGGLAFLDAATEAGQGYLRDAAWAVRYAASNRRLMLEAAAAAVERETGLRPDWASLTDTSHNHVRPERHFGEDLLVHRKGASPAAAGQPGLIPGSMGTRSYHVLGRGEPEALASSSHGAGRALPRAEARRRISEARLRTQLGGVVFDERLAAALREEAPDAYKDIDAVMRAQRGLVRIVRRLRTLVSFKGG